MGGEMSRLDYEDEDEIQVCECCGRDEYDDGQCMMCCPNQGAYDAGTEECDWCPDSAACEKAYVERHFGRAVDRIRSAE